MEWVEATGTSVDVAVEAAIRFIEGGGEHAIIGHLDEAIAILEGHHFRKWEGVGNVHDTYVDAHLLRGLRRGLRDRGSR